MIVTAILTDAKIAEALKGGVTLKELLSRDQITVDQFVTHTQAQAKLEAAAAARGKLPPFAINVNTDKGIFTFSGMPGGSITWATVEDLAMLVDHVDDLIEAGVTYGDELQAARAAYKLTGEYAAAKASRSTAMKQAAARKVS